MNPEHVCVWIRKVYQKNTEAIKEGIPIGQRLDNLNIKKNN